MKQIKKTNFELEVIGAKGIVVADFFAPWCNPCKMLSPLLERMEAENKEKDVRFVKINVDEEPGLAERYGVRSIPTVIFFKNGNMVSQHVGVSTAEEYKALIAQAKKGSPPAPDKKNEVVVFTTPTCPYCHMAKSYLKDRNIAYREIDVSRDQEWAIKMVQRSGQMGVPQLWIGGEVVIGFDRPQIDLLLKR